VVVWNVPIPQITRKSTRIMSSDLWGRIISTLSQPSLLKIKLSSTSRAFRDSTKWAKVSRISRTFSRAKSTDKNK
jgi:hypothetical protein